MPRIRFPDLDTRVVFLSAFIVAELVLFTGTWQLAYLAGFLAVMLSARIRRAVILGAASVLVAWAAYLVYVFVEGAGLQLADLVGAILGVGAGAGSPLPVRTCRLGPPPGAGGGFTGGTAARLVLWEPAASAPEAPKS